MSRGGREGDVGEVIEHGQPQRSWRQTLTYGRGGVGVEVTVGQTLAFQGTPGGDRDVRRGLGVHVERAVLALPDPAGRTGQNTESRALLPGQTTRDG